MKKSLLLTALLLSSAAQAETWVCTTPTGDGFSYLATFVRAGKEFSYRLTTPERGGSPTKNLELDPLKILVETKAYLTLANIHPYGFKVAVHMIDKQTKQYISDSIHFYGDTERSIGSCVVI